MYLLDLHEIQSLLTQENLLREIVVSQDQWYYRLTDEDLLSQSVCQIDYQSKRIDSPALFFCKGARFKAEYLYDAVDRGANFYVSEVPYDQAGIPGFIVSDIRRAMAIIAASFYDYPQKDLALIGLTGTKGKTTTNYFLHYILNEFAPEQTAFISSIDTCLDGKTKTPSDLTTPEAIDLFRMFAQARDAGMAYFIMEVSSQAYKMDRVYGVDFNYGLFSNFSPDHLGENEHPTMEDYFYCKRQFLNHVDWIILYDQLPHLQLLTDQLAEQGASFDYFGQTDRGYQLRPYKDSATAFELTDINGDTQAFKSPLPGLFNMENAAAAIIIARQLGTDDETIQRGLSKTRVEGRMERFELANGAIVYVDYAHNYDSLNRMLTYIASEYPNRRSTLVIGAPGGKGISRRQAFAEIADKYMDHVIFTEEDPNYEDPKLIAQEMQSYLQFPERAEIIIDRATAIKTALKRLSDSDVLIITGKGREKYQKVQGKNISYIGDTTIIEELMA